MTKSVAILGCGPAGLLVAHAAEISGWNFRIYSKKQKSKLYGAQYLHQAIPQLDCGPPTLVRYALRGTPEEYRRKVYGAEWDGTVSPEDFLEEHYVWDIRYTYDGIWDRYQDEIESWDFIGKEQYNNYYLTYKHDLVISTVPRKIWAEPGDVFESTKVWALGDTEDERVRMFRPPEDMVFCDGTDEHTWYRVSNIFGYCTMEWPYDPLHKINSRLTLKPPMRGTSVVEKPLRHNSKAAADFVHVGRYGAWQKGILTTDAFFESMKVLASDHV
jgi:hypothetical protein